MISFVSFCFLIKYPLASVHFDELQEFAAVEIANSSSKCSSGPYLVVSN